MYIYKKSSNANLPVNNSPSGTFNSLLRKEFLEDLPKKVRNTVRGVDMTLISEAILAIFEGRATINGKAPKTRIERYIVIASFFKTTRTTANMFFEGVLEVEHNYIVEFKHKGQSFIIKFPENPLAN